MGNSESMKRVRLPSNIMVKPDIGIAIIRFDMRVYSKGSVLQAAYVLMDKAYSIITGDPTTELVVELKPLFSDCNLAALAMDFGNEVLSYAAYEVQSEKTMELRKLIVAGAIFANAHGSSQNSDNDLPSVTNPSKVVMDELGADPLGIARQWSDEDSSGSELDCDTGNLECGTCQDDEVPWLKDCATNDASEGTDEESVEMAPGEAPKLKSLDIIEGTVVIGIDTRVYPSRIVIDSANEFTEVAWIDVKRDGGQLIVELRPKSPDQDLDTLGRTFYNYLVGAWKNAGENYW